jgi:hypothetical protein
MMIAKIMVQKKSFTSAIFHLKQLLEKKPSHWEALRLLVDMLRRDGSLASEFEKQLKPSGFQSKVTVTEEAKVSGSQNKLEPGYSFTKALYHKSVAYFCDRWRCPIVTKFVFLGLQTAPMTHCGILITADAIQSCPNWLFHK